MQRNYVFMGEIIFKPETTRVFSRLIGQSDELLSYCRFPEETMSNTIWPLLFSVYTSHLSGKGCTDTMRAGFVLRMCYETGLPSGATILRLWEDGLSGNHALAVLYFRLSRIRNSYGFSLCLTGYGTWRVCIVGDHLVPFVREASVD